MKKKIIFYMVLILSITSCQNSFLEKKPNRALLVPETLSDFQAFMDNVGLMNFSPGLRIISSDEFTNTGPLTDLSTSMERGSYMWLADVYMGSSVVPDWSAQYVQVMNANIVLDGLSRLDPAVSASRRALEIRGAALFFRSLALFNLAQEFAAPYNGATAAFLPGIPVRLVADVNKISERGTLLETYQRIEMDLLECSELLPNQVSFKNRPSRLAANALIARLYLSMENYAGAEDFSLRCLQANSTLLDFNLISPVPANPMPQILPNGNAEVIFYSLSQSYSFYSNALTMASAEAYGLYEQNDLRRTLWFTDKRIYRGSYNGDRDFFSGLANDELYLVHAECLARKGLVVSAMNELNLLLVKRYRAGAFVPAVAGSADEALRIILLERRKELFARGTRWTDLRRLNMDQRFAITLQRTVLGVSYTLEPNSRRYVFPIPDDEIRLSGILQNER